MKKIFNIFAASFAVIVAASCAKEELIPNQIDEDVVLVPYSINASISESKATISGLEVLWQEGDKIAVFDGTAKREFTLYTGAGTKTARFDGEIASTATKLSAVAPFSAAGDAAGQYNVPELQNIAAGATVDPAAVVMVAAEVAKGTDLAFSNPCGVARMTVPAGTDYASVGGPAGLYTVKFPEALSAAGDYDLVLPAGEHGDIIAVTTIAGVDYVKTTNNSLEITAGSVIKLGDIQGEPGTLIKVAADLKNYLESPSKLNAFVMNDLDLTDVELVDTATVSGVFDGRMKAIKNWTTVGKSLFKTNSGSIKNVVFDETCSLGFGDVLDGRFGFLVCESSGIVKNCINNADITYSGKMGVPFFGALIGNAEGANVKVVECINNGSITINASAAHTGTMYLGGVSGRVAGKGAEIQDCTNNGNIKYDVAVKTASNLYFGGVTGATNTGAQANGCENTGDVIFSTADGGAAVAMGGAVGYTAGNVTSCSNEGDVKYLSAAGIKGTLVGGVLGYASEVLSGCHNKGEVVLYGKTHEGRNNVGNLYIDINDATKDKATSSATVHVGGVLAAGVPTNAKTTHFAMDNCSNSGNVSYTLAEPGKCTASPASAGRHVVAGIVGDASGPVTNCFNSGNVSAKLLGDDYTAATAGNTLYVGGIVGSNYYSKTQTELTITNCKNRGNIDVESPNKHTTNHAIGGIVGWPGKESKCTSVTSKCENGGNVTVKGNIICRVGGIQGGSGRIEACTNYGKIESDAAVKSTVGGVAGFHSGGYQLKLSVNYGDVVAKKAYTSGIGGLFGNAGDATMTIGEDCAVVANVVAPEGTAAVGMIVGHFNGTKGVISIGTSEHPVKVDGTLTKGTEVTAVTAENLATIIKGDNYSEDVHTFNVTLASDALLVYANEAYKIVKLKDGNWWMAENLRFVPKGVTVSDNGADKTAKMWYPYTSDGTTCTAAKDDASIKARGYLYRYDVLLGFESFDDTELAKYTDAAIKANPSMAQGICPTGWHIPSAEEYKGLCGQGNAPYDTKKTDAVFWDSTLTTPMATVTKAEQAGWNFSFPGCIANSAYNKGVITSDKSDDLSYVGNIAMSYYPSSTYHEFKSNSFKFWSMASTFTTAIKGKLSIMDCSCKNTSTGAVAGAAVRCVKNK